MSRTPRVRFRNTQARFISTGNGFRPVKIAGRLCGKDVDNFSPNEPVVFKKRFSDMPAIARWFVPSSKEKGFHELKLSYLEQYGSTIVPLELTRHHANDSDAKQQSTFERFEAPLSLLLSHITSSDKSLALYLAQCSLADLPSDLQADLPTPSLVSRIGRGDIYASSLWMGRPPTRTPLHRDPNPNLFVQLAGRKVIRLMKPEDGKAVYERSRVGRGHANMRGEEMMAGEELERLESVVWHNGSEASGCVDGIEATLESGDALFVPLGWWHAVRGIGSGANASVNWWFR
ncbi:Clavaminate synthase-like protein [Trematosphaeria pertusa]|uniref:Clavaminate synthase-like protein n=1 Tax=Trematosphaeria pertusa TaxID=390896 RepID=A0A6A6J344_9PLEO|nr:Clavaminate synthase-like protein [Trematosphaeria pertusa]KAF2255883.1 Clavaminate synthase-like protein [Trematosphaeria pertusa]